MTTPETKLCGACGQPMHVNSWLQYYCPACKGKRQAETKPQRCPTCAAPAEPVDDMVKNEFGDYVPMWRYDARTALREALRARIAELTTTERRDIGAAAMLRDTDWLLNVLAPSAQGDGKL